MEGEPKTAQLIADWRGLAPLWRALIADFDGLGAILTDDTLVHELDDP